MSGEVPVVGPPVLLGYQTVALGGQRAEVWAKRRTLMKYAFEKGFWLGDVYVHEMGRGPTGALGALIRAAGHPQVKAVAVVSEWDLSESSEVRGAIRRWLKTESGVDLLVAES